MSDLEELLKLQRELDEKIAQAKNLKEVSVPELCRAIIHEACELEDEYNWKWWKARKDLDVEKAKIEAVDILHFLLSVFIKLDMDAEEIMARYKGKREVNIERQEKGY